MITNNIGNTLVNSVGDIVALSKQKGKERNIKSNIEEIMSSIMT